MKRLFLTLAIAAIGFTSSYAQTGAQTPAQKAEKTTEKLQKKLSLTADQKTKIYAIELDKFKKADAAKKGNTAGKSALKKEHKEIKEATDAQLDKILNPVQKKKLDILRADKKEKSKEKKAAKKTAKS